MNKITNITRKEIFDVLLITYTEDYLFGNPERRFIFWGTLMPADFLGRLYDLEKIPPKTNHYKNVKEELESLTSVARANCQPDWLFNDDRFPVKKWNRRRTIGLFMHSITSRSQRRKSAGFWDTFVAARMGKTEYASCERRIYYYN